MSFPTRFFKIMLAGLFWVAAAGCQSSSDDVLPGYAEGEYVRIASPFAGSLAILSVKRGDRVEAGSSLFALEQESERAARDETSARLSRALSQWENLRKGKRPEEISAARAQLLQAESALALSAADLVRQAQLVSQGFISPARLDEARAARNRDQARVAELSAQLKVAQLSARSDEVAAAQADVKAARELLAQADWKLAQKTQRAPRAGVVADTLYTRGEWVAAGMPVVSLLPDENIKVKFFVSEKRLGSFKIGQVVTVRCDGCTDVAAQISFISSQAEYTSPLIYSKENRSSLVFLIEARAKAADALRLHPGQPVEVRW